MKMYAEYPRKVSFEKISGDFEVYRGFWMLEEAASAKGTKLTYEIEIKPSFSVPSFIFQSMLKKDIQSGLTTVRSAAEELPASLPGSENKNPSASLK